MSASPDRLRVTPWAGALAGALAALAALAASELTAGLLGAPSLIDAVGDLVISLQPPGAKDLVATLFGTSDKLALRLFIVIVTTTIGALAGILEARRPGRSSIIFLAFGALAAVAVMVSPLSSGILGLLNAVLAVVVGLRLLHGLLSRAPRTAERLPSAAMPSMAYAPLPGPFTSPEWTRRRFLIASAGTLGAIAMAGGAGRLLVGAAHPEGVVSTSKLPDPLVPLPPLTADEMLDVSGLTPIVVPNKDFYRIDTALLVPQVDPETWKLEVKGMVDHPLTFTYDELLAMPLYEQYVTIACVSNPVGGDLVGNTLWTGALLKDVLAAAGVQAGATQIIGRSVDGFTVGFPTAWAMSPDREPMVVVGMNREPLPAAHGFPARLIVPGLYGYVSATKWLASIELTTREAVDGYWIPLGWAKDGPILTQSRIDTPTSGQRLAAGKVDIAGVAWAPDRGVSRVEVRIDDGEWRVAQMSRPISKAAWVQWALPWTATPGDHSIEARATDDAGEVQTAQASPPAPSGARGHHHILVSVR